MSGRVDMSAVVVSGFCSQDITIRSSSMSYDSHGRPVDGSPTDRTVTGSWQKVTSKELVQVGLGEIQQEVRKLLVPESEVILISKKDDTMSDRAINNGRRYKALKVDDDADFGFYRAFFSFEGYE